MKKIVAAIVSLGIGSTLAIDLPSQAAHRSNSVGSQDTSTLVAKHHLKSHKKMHKRHMKHKMRKMKRM